MGDGLRAVAVGTGMIGAVHATAIRAAGGELAGVVASTPGRGARVADTQVSHLPCRPPTARHHTPALDGGRSHHDTETVISQLEELADWQPSDEEGWYTSDSLRWREAIGNLKNKAEGTRRHDASWAAGLRIGNPPERPSRWSALSPWGQLRTTRCPRP